MHRLVLASVCLALCGRATAQAPFFGNGQGQGYLEHTALVIGGTCELRFGSPAAAGRLAAMGISSRLGPTVDPIVGAIGLDLLVPVATVECFVLDASGAVSLHVPVPAQPSLALNPPLFAALAIFEPSTISVTRTSRFDWHNHDAAMPAGVLGTARAGHTATALGNGPRANDARVLVIGGGGGSLLQPQATTSTEFYSPIQRAAVPGPSMATERALHAAVRLADGRVLVCGGVATSGIVTNAAEIFDPATGTFLATGSMSQPRTGHAATLLGNGKVLVTGGLANYVNPQTNLAAVLNTAQDTGELFDPATGLWTAVPGTMVSKRSGHAHTVLANGQVLITGGIQGGVTTPFGFDLPTYTATCNLYDPAANAFAATGSLLQGRAFHGSSRLANGDVLVTGGSVLNALFAIVGATDSCERWSGGTFAATGRLLVPATNHVQVATDDGRALVIGGLTGVFPVLGGTAAVGVHDGALFTPGRDLGLTPADATAPALPRGAMTATRCPDGTWLLLGGTDGVQPLLDALVYQQ